MLKPFVRYGEASQTASHEHQKRRFGGSRRERVQALEGAVGL